MEDISLKDLLEAGCHFGHKSERWHPKAQQFIFEERDGIHVIDLAKTKAGLIKAAELIKKIASEGGTVLFVGTKRQAAAIIKENAEKAGAPYISHHWIGGFLTNWEQVHKNLEKIRSLTRSCLGYFFQALFFSSSVNRRIFSKFLCTCSQLVKKPPIQ